MGHLFKHTSSAIAGIVLAAFVSMSATAQQDARRFRNPRMADRLATTKAAVDSLERDSRAIRRVLVDSALGTAVWLEFSADQFAAERRAGSLDAVVQWFLVRHQMVLGMDDASIQLRETRRDVDGGMVHLRYQQYWRALPVNGGELRLHLRQTAGGYVVETANGRIYPDIQAPETPAFGPSTAAEIAAARLIREPTVRVDSMADGPLFILPFGAGYRLAYSAAGTWLRATIDARSGEVLDTITTGEMATAPMAMSGGRYSKGPAPAGRGPRGGMRVQGGYVPGSGTDALNQPATFLVWSNGTDYELRSNQLGYRVSEVAVRDFGGASIQNSCPGFPVARNGTTAWPPGDPNRKQQVSAMANMVSTGNFYYDSLGRRSYDNALPGAPQAPGVPLIAGGKSFGGRMTSQAQARAALPGVRGLVFLGFPLHAPGKASESRATHLADVAIPMLFLQGTRDPLADLTLMRRVTDGLGARATLHVVEGGDHSFKVLKRSGRGDEQVTDELGVSIAEWARSLQSART